MFLVTGRGDQGRDGDERTHSGVEAAVRGARSAKGGSQSSAGFAVHAAYGRHENAANGSDVPAGRSRILHAGADATAAFLHSRSDGPIPRNATLVSSAAGNKERNSAMR